MTICCREDISKAALSLFCCTEVEKRFSEEEKCEKQEMFQVSSGFLILKDKSEQRRSVECREGCVGVVPGPSSPRLMSRVRHVSNRCTCVGKSFRPSHSVHFLCRKFMHLQTVIRTLSVSETFKFKTLCPNVFSPKFSLMHLVVFF